MLPRAWGPQSDSLGCGAPATLSAESPSASQFCFLCWSRPFSFLVALVIPGLYYFQLKSEDCSSLAWIGSYCLSKNQLLCPGVFRISSIPCISEDNDETASTRKERKRCWTRKSTNIHRTWRRLWFLLTWHGDVMMLFINIITIAY